MARAFTNEFNMLANTQPEWKGAALQYHEIVDFLNRSRISYAISADPIVSRPYLEQFWETAEHDCTVTPNVIRDAVAGHDIALSEDTIRRVLKAGKDAMGHDLAAAMVGLSLNKGYNFSRYIFKAINDQINMAERFSVDPTPKHTTLFGHLINEAYVAPGDWRWYSHDSEPELSEHSDEQQQQDEEIESEDGSSDSGDEGAGHVGAKGSDSKETESDSSNSDDALSQVHPRRKTKVTLLESSSKRKRQASSSEYESGSDSDAAIQRQRRESVHKNMGDRQQQPIPSEVVVSPQQQVQVSAASSDSASTPPSQQLYRKQRRRPQVQPDVAVTSITEEVPVIVTLPITFAQVAVTTPILTESVTITHSITPTTIITSTIPTTTIDPLSQPFNYGESTQGFDFDTIFSSPIHNAEASSSRHPDPNDARIDVLETQVAVLLETIRKSKEESDAQQAQINSLVDEIRILRSQRTGTDERLKNVMAQNELLIRTNEMILGHRSSLELGFDTQRKEHELMVKLIADLTKKLDAQGGKEKEKDKEKEKEKTTGDEACHPVDLTKDDDKDKDPKAGPSGGEHQALAIVPISTIPMAQGESTHQEGGDTSGGGSDKGKSAAEEAHIDALFNLEEGEIDSGNDWDDDEDVVIEIPKGDGEGEYELEDGEIFEFPSFEAQLDTSSVEHASNVEASIEASPGPAPVWQNTSIIDKQGATGRILAVRFKEDKQLFAIKRSGGVQYLKPTSEAFSSLPKYDLMNLANRELLGHSNHAVAMGLWVVLQWEARSGKFDMFKPQVPKRVKDKTARHPMTKKFLKKLVYKPVLCETKIPLSKLSQDILGDMWYWYVDPKTGEAVVIGKVRSESGCLVPRGLIRVFNEVCFINFSVKDLEALADRLKIEDDPELLSRGSLLKHFPVTNTLDSFWIDREIVPAYLASTQEYLCVLAKYA
ncbi:hypothetical protein L1987_09201 [Smallanthus sonchifolius]|uniref:Uncharacterized protein n=1 Tax=Smallanthus sonchifolius TaxID=185202 RepID=A0ACB9JMR1_9ASTR|nr:hypothetical protein L1987_09201 [Smallanthus sonchifolius]